jgi:plastocyanin
MSHRVAWILVGVLLVALLALGGVVVAIVATRPALQPYQQTPVVQETPVPGVTHVFMRNNAYRPDDIQVVVGTAVTWTNEDNVVHSVFLPHVVTAQSDVNLGESGSLSQGQSFTYTFTVVGTFEYHCAQHPYMIGVVIVTPAH